MRGGHLVHVEVDWSVDGVEGRVPIEPSRSACSLSMANTKGDKSDAHPCKAGA